MINIEVFKEKHINGFTYLVGDNGTIMNKDTGNTLKPYKTRDGYLRVSVGKGKLCKKAYIHRLVAMMFIDEFSDGLTVNHKDYNKENNNISNIECISREENASHSYMRNHPQIGETNVNAKLTYEQVKEIKSMLNNHTNKNISIMFKVSPTTIYDIREERTWKNV